MFSSTKPYILRERIPQDGKWQDPEVQAERDGYGAAAQGSLSGKAYLMESLYANGV